MNHRIHPTRLLLALLLALVTFAGTTSWAQSTYNWVATAGSADWTTPGNWNPARNTPAVDDILLFNQTGNSTATNIPVQTIGKLQVSASTIANLQPASSSVVTLTIATAAADAL